MTACRGTNLEKSFIFGKELRSKTTDNFQLVYTHNVVNTLSYSLINKRFRATVSVLVGFCCPALLNFYCIDVDVHSVVLLGI